MKRPAELNAVSRWDMIRFCRFVAKATEQYFKDYPDVRKEFEIFKEESRERNLKKKKMELLEAMHTIMECMGNKEAYFYWTDIAPRYPNEEELAGIADNEELFVSVVESFKSCMRGFLADGFCVESVVY